MTNDEFNEIKNHYRDFNGIGGEVIKALISEVEYIKKGNTFSCGCKFYVESDYFCWDLCDTHSSIHILQNRIARFDGENERLREAAKIAIRAFILSNPRSQKESLLQTTARRKLEDALTLRESEEKMTPLQEYLNDIKRLKAENERLRKAILAIIIYRDDVGPLNFQLEKMDDFINIARAALEGGE